MRGIIPCFHRLWRIFEGGCFGKQKLETEDVLVKVLW